MKMLQILFAVMALMFGFEASAAIDATALTAVTTSVTADLTTISTWAVGLVGAVLAVVIGIGLMKSLGKKAAS